MPNTHRDMDWPDVQTQAAVADEPCPDCSAETPSEPSEGDYAMHDTGPLGSMTAVCVVDDECMTSTYLGDFETRGNAERFIISLAKADNFRPDVWFLSDHGNWLLLADWTWD